jgi:endonuclease YncB( thermonuclease family)
MPLVGALALAVTAAAEAPPWGALLSDSAVVIDGDTLAFRRDRIRLFGIDAPELHQVCGAVECGKRAAEAITRMVADATVLCLARGVDRYGRTVAICSTDDIRDLGEAMVRAGWALDYGRYSGGAYRDAEAEARREKRGMWAGEFIPPWEWRRHGRQWR